MQPLSPFTSQGYPFSKDLAAYSGEDLGRAFFADGLVAGLGGLRLFDNINLVDDTARIRHTPAFYAGREVLVYVYTSDREAEIGNKYSRLTLRPAEVGIFAWRHEGQVEFRVKLGTTLLELAHSPSAAELAKMRVMRTEAALSGQEWTASWLLSLFAVDGKPLLDPLNVAPLDELLKSVDPIISRHDQPSYQNTKSAPRHAPGAVDVVVGLFFDGTGNNRYCTELIYNTILNEITGRVDDEKIKKKRVDIIRHPNV